MCWLEWRRHLQSALGFPPPDRSAEALADRFIETPPFRRAAEELIRTPLPAPSGGLACRSGRLREHPVRIPLVRVLRWRRRRRAYHHHRSLRPNQATLVSTRVRGGVTYRVVLFEKCTYLLSHSRCKSDPGGVSVLLLEWLRRQVRRWGRAHLAPGCQRQPANSPPRAARRILRARRVAASAAPNLRSRRSGHTIRFRGGA